MLFTTLQIIQFGVIAGIVMGIFAMALQMIGFTKLNLNEYIGCLLTGHKTGYVSFIAGFVNHLVMSALFAYVYVQVITYFALPVNLQTALIMAAANILFSGTMLKVTDAISPCTASGKVRAMNFFASGYGIPGIITYILVHFIYALVLLYQLGMPLQF